MKKEVKSGGGGMPFGEKCGSAAGRVRRIGRGHAVLFRKSAASLPEKMRRFLGAGGGETAL